MKVNSHPGKLLIRHLSEVANGCKVLVAKRNLFGNAYKKEVLKDVSFLAGAFHDLGKATSFFQHYLNTRGEEVIGPKNHALISALFVKEIVKEYVSKTTLSLLEQNLIVHMAFTSVKRHHGKLNNFEDELYIKDKSKELQEQITAFFEEETEVIIGHFSAPLSLAYSFKDFKKYIQAEGYLNDMPEFFFEFIEDEFAGLSQEEKIAYYYFHQLLFGALLLADKADVILEKRSEEEINRVVFGKIEQYRRKKAFHIPKSSIDEIKNDAFHQALDNLEKVFSDNCHVYSLTLPTGLGKTITSFAVALKMKEKLHLSNHRIVITIPFTSIIDQNFDVYRDIVETENSNLLLKHHHLAEPLYKTDEEELKPNESEFLIETWQSEVVVTTFVQLLNSIFSNDKSMLMKLPNLANSIIVLDEIQTVPYEYWQLIKSTFEILGKDYNCYFILMSATQPLMFLPGEEIVEIIPNYKKYFNHFNRTRLINKSRESMTLDGFIDEVNVYLKSNKSKDVLIILNTKKHSKQVFEALRTETDPEKEDIFYLSTLITPFERKRIIQIIKQNTGKRKIVVSTQLIEAGVDISVDTVFRAMAPVDAIIQAAGRANRYNEKADQGEVFLYDIEEMGAATSRIYGSDLILKTKNVLKAINVMEEAEYLALIQNYFKEVRKQSEDHVSLFLKNMLLLNFKEVGKFSLIEERKTKSVFLQLNEDAREVWEDYVTIFNDTSKNNFEKKQEFSKIKSKFYDYVINVSVPYDKKAIDFDSEPELGFYLSSFDAPSKFYSYDESDFTMNTGYQEMNTLTF